MGASLTDGMSVVCAPGLVLGGFPRRPPKQPRWFTGKRLPPSMGKDSYLLLQ